MKMSRIKKIALLILVIPFLTKCSYLEKKIELFSSENNQNLKSNQPFGKVCSNNETQFLINTDSDIGFYSEIFKKTDFKNKHFLEKSIILSLMELMRRPDNFSLNSRVQIFLNFKNDSLYFDVSSLQTNENSFPFLYAIEEISRKYGLAKIDRLIDISEKITPESIPVDLQLEQFLLKNKKLIEKNSQLKDFFLKGDEPITHFETFKKSLISQLYKNIYKSKPSIKNEFIQNKLNYHSKKNDAEIQCNFDFDSDKDISESSDKLNKEKVHYFAMKEGENYFFVVTSAVQNETLNNFSNSNYIKMSSMNSPIPFCNLKNSKNLNLMLFSTEGKSKSQHLKHLIEYEIYNSQSVKEISEILKFSRHLFLSDPDRILYESKRGRKDQLNFFLSMKFPIYHIDNLGNVIGVFNQNKSIHLLNDERSKAKILCIE